MVRWDITERHTQISAFVVASAAFSPKVGPCATKKPRGSPLEGRCWSPHDGVQRILTNHPPKIFVRLALHVLAQNPSAAPDLAEHDDVVNYCFPTKWPIDREQRAAIIGKRLKTEARYLAS